MIIRLTIWIDGSNKKETTQYEKEQPLASLLTSKLNLILDFWMSNIFRNNSGTCTLSKINHCAICYTC